MHAHERARTDERDRYPAGTARAAGVKKVSGDKVLILTGEKVVCGFDGCQRVAVDGATAGRGLCCRLVVSFQRELGLDAILVIHSEKKSRWLGQNP